MKQNKTEIIQKLKLILIDMTYFIVFWFSQIVQQHEIIKINKDQINSIFKNVMQTENDIKYLMQKCSLAYLKHEKY